MSAAEGASRRASGAVLTSQFLAVLAHSAMMGRDGAKTVIRGIQEGSIKRRLPFRTAVHHSSCLEDPVPLAKGGREYRLEKLR